MNPDNPYAAPQTLELIASTAIALPVAKERSLPHVRILFPDISTLALARIEAASRAIRRMTVVWTLGLALLIIGLIMTTLSGGAFGPDWLLLVAGIIALAFRISAGVERGESERYYSLLVDLAPCLLLLYVVCSELISWPEGRPIPGDAPLTALFILALLYMPVTSVMAHCRNACLFGDQKFLHDNLALELAHRRKNRIP